MDSRYDYQPGRALSPTAFSVREVKGRYVVIGPDGRFARSFPDRSAAEAEARGGRRHYEQQERRASGQVDDLGSAAVAGPDSPANPLAFEVVSYGDGGGFGVFGPTGTAIEQSFATRAEANRYAAAARKDRARVPADLGAIASSRPAPSSRSTASPSSAAPPLSGPSAPSVASGAASGVGAGPKMVPLADALAKAADALAGVAAATAAGIPLSGMPARPTQAVAPPSPARRAIDGLASAMAPAFGRLGDFKGFGDAIKGFRDLFAKDLGGGHSAASAWSAARGFVQHFGYSYNNPAGGIPYGAGGQAGSMARQAVTGLGSFAAQVGGFVGPAAQRFGAGVVAAAQAGQAGAGIGGVARAFVGGSGLLANPAVAAAAAAGAVVVGIGLAAKEFVALTERMRGFADSIAEGNRGLARWNAAVGAAYIGLGVHDFQREVRFGRATQGTAITAVRAVDQMRDDWQGVDVFRANLTNRFAGAAASFSGAVGADLSKIAGVANDGMERVDPQGLVSAGAAAGLWGGIKGTAKGYYDSFMNDPIGSIFIPGLAPYRAIKAGQDAAAAAADAKVVQLAQGVQDPNFAGRALHDWANRGGPLTRRPAPRR